jgi:Rrf2 family protein
MFSKTCEYALRAMMFIAQKSESGVKVGIKDISRGIVAPEHFIAKILQELNRKGLVQSAKGPNGGFYLGEVSRKHTMADVVRAIDGDKLFIGCGMGLNNCSEKKPCPLHDEFKVIRKEIHEMLKSKSVGDFNMELTYGKLFLKR